PFARSSVNPCLAALVEPAGPPPWSVAPAVGIPHVVTRRLPAEVALDLSRLFAYVAGRGGVKVRNNNVLTTPTLRALDKALPLDVGSELALPDRYGLYFEILCADAAIRLEANTAMADPAGLARLVGRSDAWQAYSWVRTWLHARTWFDGYG